MDWIKRNLFFVVGSVVALAMLGLAGWFLYSKYALDNSSLTQLTEDYTTLGNLNQQKPHPGSGQVDNIKAAKEQQQLLRTFIQTSRDRFQRIAPIPDQTKVTDYDFSTALSRTIDQLQRQATNASVALPDKYNFSFDAQKSKLSFAPGLDQVAAQLGEVKAICDVLFQAKINALDNVRRERISTDDSGTSASLTDYFSDKSTTNELAVMTPYEVTFRCFSPELAAVLAGFASSPYALFVKTINVEVAPATALPDATGTMVQPTATGPYPVAPQVPRMESDAFARRYGLTGPGPGRGRYGAEGAGGGGGPGGGIAYRPLGSTPTYAPQPAQPTPTTPTTGTGKGGLPTVLDEKQLKVTMYILVIKLLPAK